MFRTVSSRVSPLETEEPLAEKASVSAESLLAASSKLSRVRVEGSKKALQTVTPRRLGTFLMGRSRTSLRPSAVSRMAWMCAGSRGSIPSRWRCG